MKEIINIVIYNTIENEKKACIFYDDGSYELTDYSTGISAITKVANERNITKEQLKNMFNNEMFYSMSEKELKEKYADILYQNKETEEEIVIEDDFDDDNSNVVFTESYDRDENDDEREIIEYDNNHYYDYKKEKEKKRNCTGLKIVAAALAVLIGAGVVSRCNRKSKEGIMIHSNITTTTTLDNTTATTNNNSESKTNTNNVVYNNDLYNDYKLSELLNVTKNNFQKTAMINVSSSLTAFNSTFANNYLESGHDIKAALTFDEVVALQQAYNNYSINDVRAYFNGHEVNAINMSNDYKSASLQLMGAYIIENKEHPVDMSNLIDSQEGKEFYNKYHKMFLEAKEATGEEQLRLVYDFYRNVKMDYPVTKDVRTEGISHSESHKSLKDYQLAVAPMIAAAEMIFQNLDSNYTLAKSEINFINDIGLCNHADDKFERLETIMLGAYEDNENPLFEQYKNAMIVELVKENKYVIDDEHRELSELRRFQEIVNGDALYKHTKNPGTTNNNNGTNKKTNTRTWTKTTTTKKTTTTTRNGGPIPSDKKDEIDKKIADENKKAKEEAEKKAKEEAERLQKEAEKKKKELEEKAKQENEKKKKEAEEKAKKDNSVKNVTTDGSGANKKLPDPNEYGKDFDNRVKVKTR